VIRQFTASRDAAAISENARRWYDQFLRNQEKEARSKVFYHVYSGRDARMQLRAVSGDLRNAKSAATALINGRALPHSVTSQNGVAGVITGLPVWTRYTHGQTAVMITEHLSGTAAQDAECATFSDLLTVLEKTGNELLPAHTHAP
jgi:hypothetical protein